MGFDITLQSDSASNILTLDSLEFMDDSTHHFADSLFLHPDSLKQEDTVKIDPRTLDSTARLEHFRYSRSEVPYVELKRKKESKFFIPLKDLRKRTIEIDSTGTYVEIRETTVGHESKILLRMTLEDYINLKLALKERESWENIAYKYELISTEKGLGDLIKDITDFEIPLPSVGVLSIFGEPKISLRIGGAVDIHGAWRSETTEGVTASRLGNTRNEPDFKQTVQINVSGTIGDKLNINADWNTERTFEYENQLKIKYTGYEDEIIQSIEAGNVSLQTSPLVGGSEALFGVKANFKMGPFTLTTLASQKKGEVKEVSVSGGATSQTFTVRAYDYSINHYFLDEVYANTDESLNLFNRYYGRPVPDVILDYSVVDIEVWKSINTIVTDPSRERSANAYIELPPLSAGQNYDDVDPTLRGEIEPVPGTKETGRFVILQKDVDYTLHPETGFITFRTQIQDQDMIAVAYRAENSPLTATDDSYFGEFVKTAQSDTQKLVLKLVKPAYLKPQYKKAWRLQLKNIYPVGGRNLKQEGFEFQIKYEREGEEPVTDIGTVRLLNAFGLDRVDASGSPNPDNVFDWEPGKTILPLTGEIIFPFLEPFGNNLPSGIPETMGFRAVYDTTQTIARQDKIKDKWIMIGKYSGDASATYQLGFNIVENSVRVLLNGRELTAGVDYTVDYNMGQLTIRNDAALVAGADLKITYEQNDLFQLASKTLIGARGLLDISKKTKLGFSMLNLNQQTLSDKVRIGEEPLNNTIYGLDFSTQADLPLITKALDNIISTREMSSFRLSAEYAYINPDPNTKKSSIESDKGKSIAYIDDFEGAKRIIPVGISYTSWKDLSAPDSLQYLPGLTYKEKMDFKGKSFWFTATPSDVYVKDIWGDRKKVADTEQNITVMDYVFLPDTPGTYNYTPQLLDRKKVWGGVMKYLSSTASNLIEENIEFIEFWVHVGTAPSDAKIYLDLGRISEDVIPNRKLDTEDRPPYNNAIDDPSEDTGLDGLLDAEERIEFNSTKADPSGDNFYLPAGLNRTLFDYFNINGTEGNAVNSDIGRLPDTEDLNRNGNLDLVNSYFRYEIPLDTNASTNKYIQGGGDNAGWYLFQIPLKDTLLNIGDPTFANVEFIRLFVQGVESMVHLRLAEFNLVGSQWQKIKQEDTVLAVSVINYEDNPNYERPPGVFPEKDRTRPDQNILRNEQSLNLIITGLEDGDHREAVKYLFRPLDVFNYSEMKLFIHGDKNTGPGSISYVDTANNLYSADVYFRFGADTNNYYEYRRPVTPGWNEISILFNEITAIKQARGSDSVNIVIETPVPGLDNHYYRIKGNPTLTAVKFLSVGILNRDDPEITGPISGEVWINELRVIGADETPGWAYSLSSSLKLADLMTLNFNMSHTQASFHKLADRFGSRNETKNWSASVDLDVIKLIPFNMPESNLRINYSHTESIGKPVYLPNTDIEVEAAAKLQDIIKDTSSSPLVKSGEQLKSEVQTINISDTWSAANIRLKIPTSFWLIRDSFNALSFGFNYNKTFSRNPATLSNKTWVWNANINYGINLSPEYFFYPADIPIIGTVISLLADYRNAKIYYTPQNFTANMSARRNRGVSVTRERVNNPSQMNILRDFTATRGFAFGWKITEGGFLNLSTSYSVNISSSLLHLETDTAGVQRDENQIWRDIFAGEMFGRDNRYAQTFELRTNPRLPSLWDINKFINITANYSVGYQWDFDFRQEELGRSAGYSSKTTLGLTLRLKALMQPLFQEEIKPGAPTQTTQPRGRERSFEDVDRTQQPKQPEPFQPGIQQDSLGVDSLAAQPAPQDTIPKVSIFENTISYLKTFVRVVLFDYESISINFSNDNTLTKTGIRGYGTGFYNFWGIKDNFENGPSRGFMFGFSDKVGPRAINGNLSDAFSQRNNLDFKTSRPLWEGAKIDLTWKVNWSINKSTRISTDTAGVASFLPTTSTGTLSRSFLSIPPIFFFKNLSGITKVYDLFKDEEPTSQNLSAAFTEGFETLPLLGKLGFLNEFAKYIPRPNWRIQWDGLEKFEIFKSFTKRVSLDHGYNSSYTEGWKINPDGIQETQTQKVEYGFAPLVGLNITFAELWGGNFNSSIKYSVRTNFDLGTSTKSITENFSKDIGITAGYSKSGFEIPLFGISLKNDVEFSFSYTSTHNSTIIYDMVRFNEEGTPQDGTKRVTIEPRIKYTISSKVQLSVFYKRSTVEPEGAARIPPTTTNEAGLDVHISIGP